MLWRSPSLSSLGGDAHLQVEDIRQRWPRKSGVHCVDRDRALVEPVEVLRSHSDGLPRYGNCHAAEIR